MRAPYAVTVARVCCLILFLIMSKTAEGSESSLGHNSNTASSSHTFQRETIVTDFDDDDDDDDSSDDGMEKLGFMDEDDGIEKLGLMGEDDDDDDDDGDDHAYAFLNERDDGTIQEDGEPSKDYMKELLKDEKGENKKKKNGPAQAYFSRWYFIRRGFIYQGSRIALQQKANSLYWMDCGSNKRNLQCRRSTCPGLYLDSSDSSRCSSLFFRIYRHRGRGIVRNGDIVALYNPTRNQWFGCSAGWCARASCPGRVSGTFGFQNHEKWFRCYGEVFRIYAHNRKLGAAIMNHDPVALYYLQEHTWVRASGYRFSKSRCMGTTRPPQNSKFESCYSSTFEIHAR